MRPMTDSGEWRCAVADVPPGGSAKFHLVHGSRTLEGFVVHHDGGFYAYVNRCPHVGTPLDLWPNEFFTEDGLALVCSTHGALFAPASGDCIAGPCAGDRLQRLRVRRDGNVLVVGGAGP
jgi:nitrite reductase/ring-hydroxylating ferredoxin subunit